MTLAKALFLDRDGVINHDYDYVHRRENFDFIEGIFALVAAARAKDYKIIIVTNQAGIARGYYTEQDFHALMDWVHTKLPFDKVYFCPYHPEHGIGDYKKESDDRKPNAGMLLKAQAEYGLDLAQSILIGDRETDIAAARKAGVGTAILFAPQPVETVADHVISDLQNAIAYL